jgi:hypothetical protein
MRIRFDAVEDGQLDLSAEEPVDGRVDEPTLRFGRPGARRGWFLPDAAAGEAALPVGKAGGPTVQKLLAGALK